MVVRFVGEGVASFCLAGRFVDLDDAWLQPAHASGFTAAVSEFDGDVWVFVPEVSPWVVVGHVGSVR
ncbi:hypothetical protein G9444_6724 (plasmid) [Rhodococcus erythropolis]|uniref:Uncharacterized protein n=1 Tax=Rhodococcus erythropolis TaxID=1833 RepID=A0A6G9D407_RHOER|nr:hypothetical protein G9444_6724 [Rhodococcus erythropolis]